MTDWSIFFRFVESIKQENVLEKHVYCNILLTVVGINEIEHAYKILIENICI